MTKISPNGIAAFLGRQQPAIPHDQPADAPKPGNSQATFGTNLPHRLRIESVETPGASRKASLPGMEPVDAMLRNAARLEQAGSAWTRPQPPSTAGKKKALLSRGNRPSASEEVSAGMLTLKDATDHTAALSDALKTHESELLKATAQYEQAKADHQALAPALEQSTAELRQREAQLQQATRQARIVRRALTVRAHARAAQADPGEAPTAEGATTPHPATPADALPWSPSKSELDRLVRPGPELATVVKAWKSGAPTPDLSTLPAGLKALSDAVPAHRAFKQAVVAAHDAAQAQDQAQAKLTQQEKAHAQLSKQAAAGQGRVDTALATVSRLRSSRDQTVSQLHAAMQPSAQMAADLAMLRIRVAQENRQTLQALSAIHIDDLEKAAAGDERCLVHLERRVAHAADTERKLQQEHHDLKQRVAQLGADIDVKNTAQRAELKAAQQHMVRAQAQLLDAADRHHQLDATLKQGKAQLVAKQGELIQARERLLLAKAQIDAQVRTINEIESSVTARRGEQVAAFFQVMKQHPPGFARGSASDEAWARLQASAGRLIEKLPPDDPTAEREVPAYVKANVLLRNVALATGGDPQRAAAVMDGLMERPHTDWMPRPDAAPPSSPEAAALRKDAQSLMRQLTRIDRGVAFAQHLLPDGDGAGKSAFRNMVVYFRAQAALGDRTGAAGATGTATSGLDLDSQRWLTMAMKHASERADQTIDEGVRGGRERAAFHGVEQNFTSIAPGSDYDKTAKFLNRLGHGHSPDDTPRNNKDPLSHHKTFEVLSSAMALQGRNTPRAEANRALYLAAAQLSNAGAAEALLPVTPDRPAHEAAAGHALIDAVGEYITRHGERHGIKSSARDAGAAVHLLRPSFNGTADLSHPGAKLRAHDWKAITALAASKYDAAHAFITGTKDTPPAHPFAVPAEWKNLIRPEGRWAAMTAFGAIEKITRKLQTEPSPSKRGMPDLQALTRTVQAGALTKLVTPEQRQQFLTFMMSQMEERDKVDWSHGKGAGVDMPLAVSKGVVSGSARVSVTVEKLNAQALASPTFGSTLMTSEGLRARLLAGGSAAAGLTVADFKLGAGGSVKLAADASLSTGGGFREITEKNKGAQRREDLPDGARLVDERNADAVSDLHTVVNWRSLTDDAEPARPKYTSALEALLGEAKAPVTMAEVRVRAGVSESISVDLGLTAKAHDALGARASTGLVAAHGAGLEGFKDTGRSREAVTNQKGQAAYSASTALYTAAGGKTPDDLTLRYVHPIVGKLRTAVLGMMSVKNTGTSYDIGFQRLSGSSEVATSKAKDIAKRYEPMIVESALRWIDAMPAQGQQTRDDQFRQAMELHDHWTGFLSSVSLELSEQATLKHEQRPVFTGVPGGARAMADTAAAEGDLLGARAALATANAMLADPAAHSMKTSAVKAAVTRSTSAMTPPLIGMATSAAAYVSTTTNYFPSVRGHVGEVADPDRGYFEDRIRNAVKPLPPRTHVLGEPPATGGDLPGPSSPAPTRGE